MPLQTFQSIRTTEPDFALLLSTLKNLDSSAGIQHTPGTTTWIIKKATVWGTNQISTVQNIIDTSPATSPQLTAQSMIDRYPIEVKALVLALIDEINIIRAALPSPLPQITPAQAIAAIRAKAGLL